MGEFSKRTGDVGEDIVVDFLDLIGWNNPIPKDYNHDGITQRFFGVG
jgi:hypothetical protein